MSESPAPPLKERARELVSEVSDCPRCGSENHAIQAALLAFIDEQINALISALTLTAGSTPTEGDKK